jgi:[ribosomal protein S18]-alanine N-acetyltransferase
VSEVADVVVGPLRRRHLRGVMTIERAVYPHPWTESLFQSELALPSSRLYLVARAGRRTVGYAGIMFAPDEAHVTTIAVHPDWQRRHVATRLLVGLARGALERGYRALTLEVRVSARGAQALYRRFGMTPEGVRKGYYTQPPEDAVIMWVRDIDSDDYARLLDHLERRTERAEGPA